MHWKGQFQSPILLFTAQRSTFAKRIPVFLHIGQFPNAVLYLNGLQQKHSMLFYAIRLYILYIAYMHWHVFEPVQIIRNLQQPLRTRRWYLQNRTSQYASQWSLALTSMSIPNQLGCFLRKYIKSNTSHSYYLKSQIIRYLSKFPSFI